MTPPSPEPTEPITAILIAVVALLVSIGVWLDSLRTGRRQRQVAVGQKRTEVLVAMHDIELALEPSIRELKMFARDADPASQKLQSALDGMISIIDIVRLRRNQFTDGISPEESSHKVLLSLETLMAELHQEVKKAHAHRANVEKLLASLSEAQAERDELKSATTDLETWEKTDEILCRCIELGEQLIRFITSPVTWDNITEVYDRFSRWHANTQEALAQIQPEWGSRFSVDPDVLLVDLGSPEVCQLLRGYVDRLNEIQDRHRRRHPSSRD